MLEGAKTEKIEAFGLRLDPNIVTHFGVFIVFAVQWYFLLHLREAKSGFSTEAAGWEVAWIGVYEKSAAKATFACSITLVPAIAIIALMIRGLQLGSPSGFFLFATWSCPLLSFLTGVYSVTSVPKRIPVDRQLPFK